MIFGIRTEGASTTRPRRVHGHRRFPKEEWT